MSAEAGMVCRAPLGLVLLILAAPALALDVFRTETRVPASPAGERIAGHACAFEAPARPLPLQEAVERALCHDPKTRQAWTRIRLEAAAVGEAKAAYLPTLTATWQDMRSHAATTVETQPQLGSDTLATQRSQSLSLNWLLYDFGARGAALDSAQALLMAAQAGHEATVADTFLALAQAYHGAQYAEAALAAAYESEKLAGTSLQVAEKRVQRGLAPISDALQARTAQLQAATARVNAERDWQQALGGLAVQMGLPPDTLLGLPPIEAGGGPDADFQRAVADMMDEAARRHPSVRAARAQWQAATARVARTKAQGRPGISLIGQASRNDQPVRAYLGQPAFDATAREDQIGIRVTVPLFEGFARAYQVRQAQAQADAQEEGVADAQQQARLDVWESYQALQAASRNVESHNALLDIAQRAYRATESRYKLGVGSLLELLNAQAALTASKRQRFQVLVEWQVSKIKLALNIGYLLVE